MNITFRMKHCFKKTCFKKFEPSLKRYELGVWCANNYIVNLKKLNLPPKEWINHLVPCIQIGVNLIVVRFWVDIIRD